MDKVGRNGVPSTSIICDDYGLKAVADPRVGGGGAQQARASLKLDQLCVLSKKKYQNA